jgi:hypothetical protein
MDTVDKNTIVPAEWAGDGRKPHQVPSGEGQLGRFLLGLLLLGSDELRARLPASQPEREAGARAAAGEVVTGDTTLGALLGYMSLGVFVWGQKRLARDVGRGVRFSMGTMGRALGILNRLTETPLARPLRRPIERRVWNLVQACELAIRDGRREAHQAQLLAAKTLGDISSDLFEAIAENPELTMLIRRQVGQQSMGLAGTIVDNTRQVTITADDVAEGMMRRLLRRKPRRELPPSPLAGKPLAMYAPPPPTQGAKDDGG